VGCERRGEARRGQGGQDLAEVPGWCGGRRAGSGRAGRGRGSQVWAGAGSMSMGSGSGSAGDRAGSRGARAGFSWAWSVSTGVGAHQPRGPGWSRELGGAGARTAEGAGQEGRCDLRRPGRRRFWVRRIDGEGGDAGAGLLCRAQSWQGLAWASRVSHCGKYTATMEARAEGLRKTRCCVLMWGRTSPWLGRDCEWTKKPGSWKLWVDIPRRGEKRARKRKGGTEKGANVQQKGANIDLQRETEEKARQPEIKLGAIARTRHTARLRNARRSRTRNPPPTRRAQDML
jgi:hypothetical protein